MYVCYVAPDTGVENLADNTWVVPEAAPPLLLTWSQPVIYVAGELFSEAPQPCQGLLAA